MDAAVTAFAKYGIEGASISEVTSIANVANGTFYYHFRDKTELTDAVAHAVAASLVGQVDEAIREVSNGAERVALATQYFIGLAASDPEWGSLVAEAMMDTGEFRNQISRGIRKDVAIGIEQGHFDVELSELLLTSVLAIVGTTLRERLRHPKDLRLEKDAAEMILRVLGLPPQEARALPAHVIAKFGEVGASEHRPARPEKPRRTSE
ncbi:TetR/AcrR family transcriptional regulator [Bradyrhizobium sp. 14AA]